MNEHIETIVDATTDSTGPVKSLARGLMVLDMLLTRDSLRTKDVAEALGMDKGACSRILQTLVQAGFAEQTAGRRYRRGGKLQSLGAVSRPPIRLKERARPLLERIADMTGESAHLAVLADDQVLYIDRVDSAMALRVDRPVGTLAPLHTTALGKIFLAYDVAPIPSSGSERSGNAPLSRENLSAQLREITVNGYAIDDEEFCPGIRCVAAPLREGDAVVAAIGLSGPTARIESARLQGLGRFLAEIAGMFPAH